MNDAGGDVDYSDESDSGGGGSDEAVDGGNDYDESYDESYDDVPAPDSDEADEQDAAADGDAQVGLYHIFCRRLILVANIIACPHAPPALALSSLAGGIPPPVSETADCDSECVCMAVEDSRHSGTLWHTLRVPMINLQVLCAGQCH